MVCAATMHKLVGWEVVGGVAWQGLVGPSRMSETRLFASRVGTATPIKLVAELSATPGRRHVRVTSACSRQASGARAEHPPLRIHVLLLLKTASVAFACHDCFQLFAMAPRKNAQSTSAELSLVHLKNCLVNLPPTLVSLLVNVNTVSYRGMAGALSLTIE